MLVPLLETWAIAFKVRRIRRLSVRMNPQSSGTDPPTFRPDESAIFRSGSGVDPGPGQSNKKKGVCVLICFHRDEIRRAQFNGPLLRRRINAHRPTAERSRGWAEMRRRKRLIILQDVDQTTKEEHGSWQSSSATSPTWR